MSVNAMRSSIETKEQGVQWLAQVPKHWTIAPLKRLVTFQRGHDLPAEDRVPGDVPIVSSGGIIGTHNRSAARGPGIVTGRYGSIGTFYLIQQDYWPLNTSLYSIDLNGNDPRYAIGVLSSLAPFFEMESRKSAVPGVDRNDLHVYPVPIPPLEEQCCIADFLDRRTAAIDALIAKQEQLLALLAEKRQALITQAVTKGLDPNVPMKDSGVEWLGPIPSHWTMQALRHRLRRIEQGWSPACENREAEEDEWGVLKVGCVNYGRFREGENKALPADLAPLPEYEVRVGDVLVSRANTRELVGSAALVDATRKRLLLCDKLFRLHYCPSVNPQFLVLLLQSAACRHQLEADATGASGSMQNIGQDSIRRLLFAWPPLDEQHWIVEHVQKELQRLDALSQRVQTMVEKLREYRQALITAAVTGQLDVTTIEVEPATNVVEAATA